jgi:hypothetical protein
MSELSSAQKAMFDRISASSLYPISAFAGGKDSHTILSCCRHSLVGMLSQVAATQLRLAHPVECPVVFPVPDRSKLPVKYSLVELDRRTQRGVDYYECLHKRAPAEFNTAFHYLWYLRHIPRNVHSRDTVFINDSTFRCILRQIFCKLHSASYVEHSEWNWYQAMEMHYLVKVMGCATKGLNPHCEEIWADEIKRANRKTLTN